MFCATIHFCHCSYVKVLATKDVILETFDDEKFLFYFVKKSVETRRVFKTRARTTELVCESLVFIVVAKLFPTLV